MWQTEMVLLLRHMIDDVEETYRYSDSRLQELILAAAQLTIGEISFAQEYSVDIDAHTLTPDPTDSAAGTRENWFIDLVSMKAACVLDRGRVRKAVNSSFIAKEGNSMVDVRDAGKNAIEAMKHGWCKAYTDSKFEYEVDRTSDVGAVILTPFKTDTYTRGY